MAAQAASEMIFFIGSVIVSAALVGVFFTAVTQVSDSIQQNAHAAASEFESGVTILNDPSHVAYNGSSQVFTLWVKNTGTRSLSLSHTVVLLDDRTFANDTYAVAFAANATSWAPQVVAVFSLTNVTLPSGQDHFLKVIGEFGTSDSQEFYY
jgi:flagellar protein FlaG